MIDRLLEYLIQNPPGPWIGPLLAGVAFVETVFPPLPGDVLFVVLSGWAITGGMPAVQGALFGLVGCFLASCLLFVFGSGHGRRFVKGWLSRKVDPDRVNRAGDLIAARGPLILAFSRFIPGIRSLLVIMAASSGMRFRSAVLPIAASAAVWYAALSAAGVVVGDNMEAAERFMNQFEIWIWATIALLIALFYLLRRGRKRGPAA